MDSLWICEVKDNVTQVHFFCLIPWNKNGSLKEDWDLIQAIGCISTVMISFVHDYNFFLNGIYFILWRMKSMAWISWTWSIVFNGLDFMNMIYCVPWSKSIKGILCSSFFLHHCWAEGACTYHFTIRLLICNAILFFSFLGCLWTLCCIWTFKTRLH